MTKKKDKIPIGRDDLELYLFTIETYFRLAKDLPVNSTLASSTKGFPDAVLRRPYNEEDYIGIIVRLMLQRKYFVQGERVYLRGLFEYVRNEFSQHAHEIDEIESLLDSVNQPFRVSFPNRFEICELWEGIEPIIYGNLLHADKDKAGLLSQLSEPEWMMIAMPFVLGREEVLLQLRELLIREGVKPYSVASGEVAPVLCWGDTANVERSIKKSPYWANLAGREADDSEIAAVINNLDDRDREVLTVCLGFFAMLCAEEPNIRALKKSVIWWVRRDWGDFSEAIEYASGIANPGYSSTVRYHDGGAFATVRIWPKVTSNFFIEHPQATEQIEIRAIRSFGRWKIHSMGGCMVGSPSHTLR